LFFELSNEDRLRILHQLNKEAKKVAHLSDDLGLPTQEISRHLSRLGEAGVTRKDVDGLYHITPLGELILREISALRFTMQHKEYFATHSLERLPTEFVSRIGELSDSKYVNEATVVFYTIEKMFERAEKHVWTITNEYPIGVYPLVRESLKRGVPERNIETKDRVRSIDSRSIVVSEEDRQALIRARAGGLHEERVLDRLDIWLFMSEKEVAAVGFPLLDGSFDYLAFIATDRRSRKWCKDLFRYYWERARLRASVAEELYGWLRERPKAIHAFKSIAAGEEIVDGEELISELENMSLIKQGKLTLLGELVAGKYCMYCGTPNPRGDAFCQTCRRRMPDI